MLEVAWASIALMLLIAVTCDGQDDHDDDDLDHDDIDGSCGVVVTISRGVVSAAPAPHLRFERFCAVCTLGDFGRCREFNNLIIGNPYFVAVLLCIYSTSMQGVMFR